MRGPPRAVLCNEGRLMAKIEGLNLPQRMMLRQDLELVLRWRRINAKLVEGRKKRLEKKLLKVREVLDERIDQSADQLVKTDIDRDDLVLYRRELKRVLPALYSLNHQLPSELIKKELIAP